MLGINSILSLVILNEAFPAYTAPKALIGILKTQMYSALYSQITLRKSCIMVARTMQIQLEKDCN